VHPSDLQQKYFENPGPENMPLLEDLYNAPSGSQEPEAKNHVATALEIYVKGSLNVFNHRTNVDINNRLVCYDIKELGKQLKKIGMLVVQDQVWGSVTENRSEGKATRYYMDEIPFCSVRSRRRPIRWRSGSDSENGAAFPPESRRT
jgi:hypothetical protein